MLNRLILSLINIVLAVVEIIIGLRIVLEFFGASSSASFVTWIYETSRPLLRPFFGIFPSTTLEGVFTIDFTALFALIIYALAGYLLETIVYEVSRFSNRK